jgi:hypothetical protein
MFYNYSSDPLEPDQPGVVWLLVQNGGILTVTLAISTGRSDEVERARLTTPLVRLGCTPQEDLPTASHVL